MSYNQGTAEGFESFQQAAANVKQSLQPASSLDGIGSAGPLGSTPSTVAGNTHRVIPARVQDPKDAAEGFETNSGSLTSGGKNVVGAEFSSSAGQDTSSSVARTEKTLESQVTPSKAESAPLNLRAAIAPIKSDEAPEHLQHVDNLTRGIGGMIVTAPGAALEAISPAVSQKVHEVATALGQHVSNATTTVQEYATSAQRTGADLARPYTGNTSSQASTASSVRTDSLVESSGVLSSEDHGVKTGSITEDTLAKGPPADVNASLLSRPSPVTEQYSESNFSTRKEG